MILIRRLYSRNHTQPLLPPLCRQSPRPSQLKDSISNLFIPNFHKEYALIYDPVTIKNINPVRYKDLGVYMCLGT